MDIYEAIEKRYSVRDYAPKDVDDDKLRRVLDAGRTAPSARNLQQWKFVVVRDAGLRKELAHLSDQPWMASAPVIVAVVSTKPHRIMHCNVPAAPVDCAIAITHMTLAATAEGLGTCWIGHFNQHPCKQLLGVPEQMQIIEMLTVGHAAGDAKVDKPRKEFDEVVCVDRFA
ncbi:MAG: nitroreductase [Planctomycetes bacterium]|jgi:nitroreductase|nr:nitroreductase family protein [Phycisphaerae bacterium]NBB95139.1 nitroreductase [Planctomycetota bacterium]